MQTLIDTDYLRTNFDIGADISDPRLVSRIGAASRRLRHWVGDDVYQSVLNGSEAADRRIDFKLAEANLTMHFAIVSINAPVTTKGVVKAMKGEDNAVISYLTPNETAQLKELFLQEADEIIRPYRDAGEDAGLGIVSDGGCSD